MDISKYTYTKDPVYEQKVYCILNIKTSIIINKGISSKQASDTHNEAKQQSK